MQVEFGNIYKIYNIIIDYVFPPSCLNCSIVVMNNKSFCNNCWNNLNFISAPYCKICGSVLELSILEEPICAKCIITPPNFNSARSLLKFDKHSKNIIHAFKYFDKTVLGETFAILICNRYKKQFEHFDCIAPVPMNRFKRLFRMYNPAQIIASHIALIIQKPILADLLIKTKWTKSQTILSKKSRIKNLANSLKFNTKYNISGKKILLVDDVITTGATINKCSKILKIAGAENIFVISVLST